MPPAKKAAAKKSGAKPASLAALRDNLEKRYGAAVMRRDRVVKYEVIPTGSLTLDLAHRTGGWVRGRMHEVVGPEGVGKTSVVISSMAQAQRLFPDRAVAYIDMEQTFDYDWAEALGLDTSDERFLHVFPDDAEDVSDLLRQMAETALFPMIVVDSIGGMESKEAFEKDAGDRVMGRNAQVITRMVKNCAVLCRKHNVTVLLVNQLRANLGNPQASDQSAGPKALRYATSTKVTMSRTGDEPIKHLLPGDTDPVEIGRKIRARVVRSKVAIQGKAAEFYLFNADTPQYGPVGIDQADEAVTIGVYTEVIDQRGAWYYFTDASGHEVKFQGRSALLTHLRSCPDDLEHIRSAAVATTAHEVREEVETTFEVVQDQQDEEASA